RATQQDEERDNANDHPHRASTMHSHLLGEGAFYSRAGIRGKVSSRGSMFVPHDALRCQASERDSPKPGSPFFSSPASRISPQSKHSTYCASASFAINCVRLCGQGGSGVNMIVPRISAHYITCDLRERVLGLVEA